MPQTTESYVSFIFEFVYGKIAIKCVLQNKRTALNYNSWFFEKSDQKIFSVSQN